MSPSDLADFTALTAQFRRDQSEFTDTGVKKQGQSLTVAREIAKYYLNKGNLSNEELTPELKDKWEQERKKALAQGDDVYNRWMKIFSISTYDKEVFEKMQEGGREVDEEKASKGIGKIALDTILGNLGMTMSDFNNLPQGEQYSYLYNKLKEKRSKLVAPYKELGDFNQIKGDLIDENPALKTSLDRVTRLMSYFPMTENNEAEIEYETIGNNAFQNKIKTLKGEDLRNFMLEHTEVNRFGKQVIKTFYYRTYVLKDKTKNTIVNQEVKPSFNWIINNVEREEQNPNYSFELAEKGIPQFNDYVKQQYKNQKFFDLFGIDSNTDFYAQKEATKNKELFGLRKLMLEEKAKSDKREGVRGKYFTLPSVASSGVKETVFYSDSPLEAYNNAKSILAKSFTLATEDESGVATVSTEKTDENTFFQELNYKNKLFTRYRNVLRDSEGKADPTLLSNDVTYMYLTYLQEGVNVEEKAKILPEVNMFIDKLENTTLDGKEYNDSNLKKALEPFIRRMIYGQSMDSGYVLNIFGKQLSTTKALQALYQYASKVNLGFNTAVATTGFLNSQISLAGEGFLTSKFVDKDNTTFAYSELGRLSPEAVGGIGGLNPKSKLLQLHRFSTMTNVREINQGLTNSRFYRAIGEQVGFLPMELAGYVTSSMSILSMVIVTNSPTLQPESLRIKIMA
jgi:hypothetical protein